MVEHINLANVLFLDIETVPAHRHYDDLPDDLKKLWAHKALQIARPASGSLSEDEVANTYERAGIYAEFGKIICISVGIVANQSDGLHVRVKSFANADERELLLAFSALVEKHYHNPDKHSFCGHNIKEFDIPYICRRLAINGLPLPKSLDVTGKKPWQVEHLLDTLEMWKFGDYKNYTSLNLLTNIFGIPTPKDDIDGSEVRRVFWEDNDLERIAIYCEKDVVAVIQLLLKYQRKDLLPPERILRVTD
jgi:DNA polymerase elongation subunit (family B)